MPNLSVGKIELDVDNLQAEVNLAAQVANLVSINAGVSIGVKKVNITIADVEAQLELIIRLGHLVDIVNRTLQSLDLNPLLINILNDVTDLVDTVIGEVDGLLGSIIQGTSKINFLIDNLGNIVQEVVGDAGKILSSIVGNYQDNMTFTGNQKDLGNGLIQKTFSIQPAGKLGQYRVQYSRPGGTGRRCRGRRRRGRVARRWRNNHLSFSCPDKYSSCAAYLSPLLIS